MNTANDDRESMLSYYSAEPHRYQPRPQSVCDTAVVCTGMVLFALCVASGAGAAIAGSLLLHSVVHHHFSLCVLLLAVGGSATAWGVASTLVASVVVARYWVLKSKESARRWTSGGGRFVTLVLLPALFCVVSTALLLASVFLYSLSQQLPNLDRPQRDLVGLEGTVTIVRDEHGFTHIDAKSRGDVLFGQGWAQAQDRLWQLEFARLVAKGELSAHVGHKALTIDKQARTLQFKEAGDSLCAALTPSNRDLVKRFVGGINAYLISEPQRPPEFAFMSTRLLFYHRPQPFVVNDVCYAARLLQWQLTTLAFERERERFRIFMGTDRTYDEVEELFTNQTNISNTVLSASEMGLSEEDAIRARQREAADASREAHFYDTVMAERRRATRHTNVETLPSSALDLSMYRTLQASNAWASREAGKPCCGATDPHLTVTLPPIWYYSDLHFPGAGDAFSTSGFGVAGIPGVHIGKTTHVSWGITMASTDLADQFILDIDPEDGSRYIVDGQSLPLDIRTEVIHVLGADDVTIRVRSSRYGPIVSDVFAYPSGFTVSLLSRALMPDTQSANGILGFSDPAVRTAEDFRGVIQGLRCPAFSIPIADRMGTVGYAVSGSHPLRVQGHTGRFPTLGNGSFDYLGEVPMTALPTLMSPSSEGSVVISAANQKIYPDGYNYTLGYDYPYPYRGGRLHELLTTTAPLSSRPFHLTVQQDVRSNAWAAVRPLLLSAENFNASLGVEGVAWFDRLMRWDGHASIGSEEAAFFWMWYRQLLATPSDAVRAASRSYVSNDYVLKMLQRPSPRMTADCHGSCAARAAALLQQQAAAGFTTRWGIDVSVVHINNQMMHNSPLACLFDRQIQKGGDRTSINVANTDLTGPIRVLQASSNRQLFDWASDIVWANLPGGNSGNPYGSRYDNLLQDWASGIYVNVTSKLAPSMVVSSQTLYPQ